ncbi:MAG TPA: DUF4321 domain-containing protein [Gemmatimonadales bacterium]|nr:DUF4321 domain-containing protein [Gemmatimonadales bacterium]
MANVPRRPLFYLGVLSAGFVLGGFLHALLEQVLPAGAPKEVLTFAVTPRLGPVSIDLLVLSFTLGPVGITVSVMAVVGVVLAYLLARSLF